MPEAHRCDKGQRQQLPGGSPISLFGQGIKLRLVKGSRFKKWKGVDRHPCATHLRKLPKKAPYHQNLEKAPYHQNLESSLRISEKKSDHPTPREVWPWCCAGPQGQDELPSKLQHERQHLQEGIIVSTCKHHGYPHWSCAMGTRPSIFPW